MRILKVNKKGELVRENGLLVFAEGVDAIVQLITQKLQVIKGEWFFNLDLGVDYFNVIFPKQTSDFKRFIEFRKTIDTVPGVVKVTSMQIEVVDARKRHYKITAKITTDLGIIDYEEVLV